jgi:hypothetical protein
MPEPRVIVVHPDGRRYSVTRDAFRRLYAPQGFAIEGPETGSAFAGALGRTERPARRRVRGRFVRET